MPIIKFTPAEQAALLHRLEIPDAITEVFADSDHLEHMTALAGPAADDLARQLTNYGHVIVEPTSNTHLTHEARRQVLIEAIEGSTWIAVHDNADTSLQKLSAVRRSLATAAAKIETALALEAGIISIPEV